MNNFVIFFLLLFVFISYSLSPSLAVALCGVFIISYLAERGQRPRFIFNLTLIVVVVAVGLRFFHSIRVWHKN